MIKWDEIFDNSKGTNTSQAFYFLTMLFYPLYLLGVEISYRTTLGDSFFINFVFCYCAYIFYFILLLLRQRFQNQQFKESLRQYDDPESPRFKNRIEKELNRFDERNNFYSTCIVILAIVFLVTIISNIMAARNENFVNWERIVREAVVIVIFTTIKYKTKQRLRSIIKKYSLEGWSLSHIY